MQMRTRVCGLACVGVLVLMANAAEAQQRRGFSGRTASSVDVAAVPEVAKVLQLSDEQSELAKKLVAERRKLRQEVFQNLGDLTQEQRRERFQKYNEQSQKLEKQLAESVGEEKIKRINQLSLQASGVRGVFFGGAIARKLEVTTDQRNQASQAARGMREEFRAAGNDAEARAKLVKKLNEKLAGFLTDEQKNKWKELLGKPASEALLAKIRAATSTRRRSN